MMNTDDSQPVIANTGICNISKANPNLDGSGEMGIVLTSPDGVGGTKIFTVTVKATESTREGMVRLFVGSGESKFLWKEIFIPAVTQTPVVGAYRVTINKELTLNPGESLFASTQHDNSFNVLANAEDWTNCECNVNPFAGRRNQFAFTGLTNVSTANPNLDGSGAMNKIITVPVDDGGSGLKVNTIIVKATGSTKEGMVRIFLNDTTKNFLIGEVHVEAGKQTGVEQAFEGAFACMLFLKAGYSLLASTENNDSFNVIINTALGYKNCSCK